MFCSFDLDAGAVLAAYSSRYARLFAAEAAPAFAEYRSNEKKRIILCGKQLIKPTEFVEEQIFLLRDLL